MTVEHPYYASDAGKQFKRMEVVAEPEAIPAYAHVGDAGMDLRAAEDVVVRPAADQNVFGTMSLFCTNHNIVRVRTGLKIALPPMHVGFIVPRSGLGSKGLTVANSPGIIDAGYRGEIQVALVNHSRKNFEIKKGDRIAQLVVVPFTQVNIEVVDEFSEETERGEGGFGSTGSN